MYKIVLIGAGNVATHLLAAFYNSQNTKVVQVYSRNTEVGKILSKKYDVIATDKFDYLVNADLYLICVSDYAIPEVSNLLPFEGKLVAHTSGATDISAINSKNRMAVFYPLQSFSNGVDIDFSPIPICIEALNSDDLKLLFEIGKSISSSVQEISSKQRQLLHISAVFVNNFVNHILYIANDLANHNGVNFDLLKPIIEETISKAIKKTPLNTQTGPAMRGDTDTIKKHLRNIQNDNYRKIYELISKSILDTYA